MEDIRNKHNDINNSTCHDLKKIKLQAEISKINEERLKIELERLELKNKISLPSKVLRTLLWIVGSFTLLWFYFIQIGLPISRSENIKIGLENEIVKKELYLKEQEYTKKLVGLDSMIFEQNKSYQQKLSTLLDQNNILVNGNNILLVQYDSLSTKMSLTQVERNRYSEQANSLRMTIERQEKQIEKFEHELVRAKDEQKQLIREITNKSPDLVIKSHYNGQFTNEREIVLSGVATDSDDWVSRVLVRNCSSKWYGASYDRNTNIWTRKVHLDIGQNIIELKAEDNWGLWSAPISIIIIRVDSPYEVSVSRGTFTDKIEISWNNLFDGAYYKVLRYSAGMKEENAKELTNWSTNTFYNDYTAKSGIKYYYRVLTATDSFGTNRSQGESWYGYIKSKN